MEDSINLRALSLETLLAIEKDSIKSSEIINGALERYRYLPKNQRSFYKRLTEGTIEQKIKLDYIIGCYSKTPVKKLKPVIRNILRLSVYQIKEMNSVPDNAAVDEAVKLAKKKGFGQLRGFVNAVLRNIIRDPKPLIWPERTDIKRYISVMYSMPEYIVENWIGSYGAEKTEQICKWFLEDKKLTVRLRGGALKREKMLSSLKEQGITAEKAPYLDYAYYISGFDTPDEIRELRSGDMIVQNLSSMLAVEALNISEGSSIADVCAAPGGKTLLAADMIGEHGKVFSRDISEKKVMLINENLDRCGISNVEASVWDASVTDESLLGKMDAVIADAPCSGYGVIGHKPDIKYRASAENEKSLADIQRKILNASAGYVKKGGMLLYSTCTVSKAENEENAEWFLAQGGFERVDLKKYLPEELFGENNSQTENCLQILPGEAECDGFFISCFRKL